MFRPEPTNGEQESLDDRTNDEADFEVDEYFSSTNTNFGGSDPAKKEKRVAEGRHRDW